MGKLLRERKGEGKGEKERSAAMRSAPPPAHPGAISHHTTHHHRDDTATAVPRVLSWRQPRARYRGVTERGKSSRGMGRNDLGIQAGSKPILAFDLAANIRHSNHQFDCVYYITLPNQCNKKQLYQYSINSQPFIPPGIDGTVDWEVSGFIRLNMTECS